LVHAERRLSLRGLRVHAERRLVHAERRLVHAERRLSLRGLRVHAERRLVHAERRLSLRGLRVHAERRLVHAERRLSLRGLRKGQRCVRLSALVLIVSSLQRTVMLDSCFRTGRKKEGFSQKLPSRLKVHRLKVFTEVCRDPSGNCCLDCYSELIV